MGIMKMSALVKQVKDFYQVHPSRACVVSCEKALHSLHLRHREDPRRFAAPSPGIGAASLAIPFAPSHSPLLTTGVIRVIADDDGVIDDAPGRESLDSRLRVPPPQVRDTTFGWPTAVGHDAPDSADSSAIHAPRTGHVSESSPRPRAGQRAAESCAEVCRDDSTGTIRVARAAFPRAGDDCRILLALPGGAS
jgi:hypothetical protein